MEVFHRAADLIGQLADIDYLRKTSALFAEFQETGTSEKRGYQTPDDLRAAYPAFFWQAVRPYIGDALRYLQVTQEGKQWIANLYAHVFSEEHRGAFGATKVSLHTRAVCLRHLRYFGSFLTESGYPRHVRFTPDSDCRADSSVRQLRAISDSVNRSIRARFSARRHRPRRRPAAQGRGMSNGCTFSPPVIRGFDGSKRSRSSRFLTSARATTKASFRLLACRSATLKKALPK